MTHGLTVTQLNQEPQPMIFESEVVKALLGGKWPEYHGYGFGAEECWMVTTYGTLTPMDGRSADAMPVPGPDFRLEIVNDDVFMSVDEKKGHFGGTSE